jgi:hypothetical protein
MLLFTKGTGNKIATSTSKIKKITVITKNRREKDARILCSGSNPHSNALSFSRFIFILFVFSL